MVTFFAIAVLTYRYTLWLGRPPTWRYFRAGWTEFLSWRNFRRYTLLIPRAWWTDIFGQTFIRKRSTTRWVMHLAIFWGVIVSLLVTVPLTFGWFRFTLVEPDHYKAWFFGIPIITFPIEAGTGFAIFHILDFTAVLLIAGLAIAIWRRVNDLGLLATQRFGFDLMPLVLLFAIAVTGLALTASYEWWDGRFYWFLSLTHQVTVVLWLLSLPVREVLPHHPATGEHRRHALPAGQPGHRALPHGAGDAAAAPAARCGNAFPSAQLRLGPQGRAQRPRSGLRR